MSTAKPVFNPASSTRFELTADQVRFFHEQGYLSLERLTTPEEILDIRSTIESLFEQRAGENEGAYGDLIESAQRTVGSTSPQIQTPINYAPQLGKTRCFANALGVARQLLGNDARFLSDVTILKEARIGVATPWHQDTAFRDPRFERKEVTVWVPLQEVRVETGCLQFIPGSHLAPVRTHRPANNDPKSQALECTENVDEGAAVSCPLPVGGCTIHQSYVLHGSKPNISDVPRFTYIMVFGATPTRIQHPQPLPWQEQRQALTQTRKRRWMRRGGFVVSAWRRIRRGDVRSWHSAVYWLNRAVQTLRKGA